MGSTEVTKRIVFFDYLKVFAALAVIIIHVTYQNYFSVGVNTYEWQTMNFFNSISRWGIMIFIMISGALFLNRDISIKKLYSKYILRLVIVFIVWSIFYAFLNYDSVELFVETFLYGYYHMWFILRLLGLYICIPIIKLIVKDKKITKYFLILAFVFEFLISTLYLFKYFGITSLNSVVTCIYEYSVQIKPSIILGYTSYFILGYYLNNIDLNKKQRIIIYILGIIGFIATIVLNSLVSIIGKETLVVFNGDFSINVLLETIAIFTFFKYSNFKNIKLNSLFSKLSTYTLGIYLVHPFILEQIDNILGLNSLTFDPIVSTILVSLIVMFISTIISFILHKIPIIKEYIV